MSILHPIITIICVIVVVVVIIVLSMIPWRVVCIMCVVVVVIVVIVVVVVIGEVVLMVEHPLVGPAIIDTIGHEIDWFIAQPIQHSHAHLFKRRWTYLTIVRILEVLVVGFLNLRKVGTIHHLQFQRRVVERQINNKIARFRELFLQLYTYTTMSSVQMNEKSRVIATPWAVDVHSTATR